MCYFKKNPVKNLIIALKICMCVHFFLTGTRSVYFGWIRYICKISISYVNKKGIYYNLKSG